MKIHTFGALAASVIFLTGCSEVSDYYADGQLVMVDGEEFFVRQPKSQEPNVYSASPNKPPGSSLYKRDFSLPAKNVAAIEAVSGCKVDPVTVLNTASTVTFAAVNC